MLRLESVWQFYDRASLYCNSWRFLARQCFLAKVERGQVNVPKGCILQLWMLTTAFLFFIHIDGRPVLKLLQCMLDAESLVSTGEVPAFDLRLSRKIFKLA